MMSITNITKTSKFAFLILLFTIGAIFIAPKCYATDVDLEFEPPSDSWPGGNDVAEQIFDKGEELLGSGTIIKLVTVYISSTDTLYGYTLLKVDVPVSDLKFYVNSYGIYCIAPYGFSNWSYARGYYRVYNADQNRDPILDLPSSINSLSSPRKASVDGVNYFQIPQTNMRGHDTRYVNFSGRTLKSSGFENTPYQPIRPLLFGDYTVTEPPKDGSVLAYEYVARYGFKSITATAWLRNEQGRMFKIPISYTPPDGYTGLYCKPYQVSSTLYGYQVALTPGENPLDYEYYWDMHLVVEYEDVSFTTLDTYIVLNNTKFGADTMLYKNPSDFVQFDNQTTEQGYFNLEGTNYIGTLAHLEFSKETTTSLYFAGRWWEENVGVSDMIIGISFVSTDENGDTTAGKGSEDYNKFLEEYTKAIMLSLTGFDNGPSSFQADWSGQSLSSTAKYNNKFTFSDNTGKMLFTKLFSMGNGFVLSAAVGVLSIAIAAYVLFGKS